MGESPLDNEKKAADKKVIRELDAGAIDLLIKAAEGIPEHIRLIGEGVMKEQLELEGLPITLTTIKAYARGFSFGMSTVMSSGQAMAFQILSIIRKHVAERTRDLKKKVDEINPSEPKK